MWIRSLFFLVNAIMSQNIGNSRAHNESTWISFSSNKYDEKYNSIPDLIIEDH